ncbi:zinc finger and BTB domain-containing protein 41 isoform X1 [Folsomia candida]|uniref:zinc finger and BTB domain-containing protein 41 isoform X1 n=2 Tax=Folsomia candida TaxID=158441 RepID=UPI000B8F9351|nr:zinc finger and BTB domain-containing protein 41 isoform X1 [Folsomia candida]XP_021959124.1 zinc finger and BTB domain-containing protein 41 isoform X1 [Folsomia candida]XP_035711597.1 zinc finger and BTB domain-containing protein 41 isoform X1 [Folsomia candida]
MSKDDGFSNSGKNGGHILEDLLSSTVLLARTNFVPIRNQLNNFPVKIEENISSPEVTSCCSICSESTNLLPLAVQEMEILAKFVLSQEQISLILQTEDHPPIFCCKICSSAILSLAKLSTQIENITISLRAVISSRNGLFNKLRNEAKIIESSQLDAHQDVKLSPNDDHPRLTGWIEEEFSVKIEPIEYDEDDHEISPNPEEDLPFSGSNCDFRGSKFACKICQPTLTFSTRYNFERHMKQKHPKTPIPAIRKRKLKKQSRLEGENAKKSETSTAPPRRKRRHMPALEKPHPCPECEKRFISRPGLRKHVRVVHEGFQSTRKCAFCPKVFSSMTAWQKHVQEFHHVVKRKAKRFACDMCTKMFINSSGLMRHVELIHFTDRKSCPYGCPTQFGSKAEWVTHLEGCQDPKMSAKYGCVCLICKTTFRNIILRMEHFLREHPNDAHSCRLCGAKFARQDAFYFHRCDEYEGFDWS